MIIDEHIDQLFNSYGGFHIRTYEFLLNDRYVDLLINFDVSNVNNVLSVTVSYMSDITKAKTIQTNYKQFNNGFTNILTNKTVSTKEIIDFFTSIESKIDLYLKLSIFIEKG